MILNCLKRDLKLEINPRSISDLFFTHFSIIFQIMLDHATGYVDITAQKIMQLYEYECKPKKKNLSI